MSLEHGFKASDKKEFKAQASTNDLAATSGSALAGGIAAVAAAADPAELARALAAENEQLKQDLAQKEVRIRQLEAQLAAAQLK